MSTEDAKQVLLLEEANDKLVAKYNNMVERAYRAVRKALFIGFASGAVSIIAAGLAAYGIMLTVA